ncbi:MAG: glycosyl transferase [Pseudomonadota bacterium]
MPAPPSFLIQAGIGLVVAFATSVFATRLVLAALRSRQILDHPNHRSSHAVPTPRGGGWGVLAGMTLGTAVLLTLAGIPEWLPMLAAATILVVALSWLDDLGDLPAFTRLLVQFMAVAVALAGLLSVAGLSDLDAAGNAFGTVVGAVGLVGTFGAGAVVMVGYVWFVNLYNFMDGIDGITAVQTLFILCGIALVSGIAGRSDPELVLFPPVVAAAAGGFLVWNWHPAKVFLGDVGSVPLGLVVGFFLATLAAKGHVASALILPLYYIADATLTLLRRILRREAFWRPHRTHWYQRAALSIGHRKTVLIIAAGNAGLVALSILALARPVMALVAALAWTTGLLVLLSRSAGVRRSAAAGPAP